MKDEIVIPERLVFFEGCTTSRALPETRLATYIILEKMVEKGIIKEYKTIPNERCCGYASMVIGDFKTQKKNVLFNLNALTRIGIPDVLFTCGACTQFLGNEPEFRRRDFRSINIIELLYALAKRSDLEKLIDRKLPEGTKITGHYSCHLRRLAGVKLKELYGGITEALGASYVEMKDAEGCCGAGSEGDVAMAIAKKKVENANNSGADFVPLACAGCEAMLAVASKQAVGSKAEFISLSSLVVSCFDDLDKWIDKLGGTLKEPTPKDAPSDAERTLESIKKPAETKESTTESKPEEEKSA
ncbi:MAG: (Fe-S)-binding protein [Candidatus Altiarchaeota archaeon]|nr:(Fe-S)-binding protein [Candidatus Altiarchaeota archaeon]